MKSAYPNKVVELTAPEMSYILKNRGALAEIIKETESYHNRISDFLTRGQTVINENDRVVVENNEVKSAEKPTLKEAAMPLMDYLAEHFDTDETIALVGANGVEIVASVRSIFRD